MVLLLGLLATVATVACAQEQERPTFVEVHVDVMASNAADDNPGTRRQPLATIMEALRRADANRLNGRATKVVVHPGTYRESLVGPLRSREGEPIVIEAAVPGEAIVSGSDVWTDWNCQGSLCTHAWPFEWGLAEVPWPQVELDDIGRRREMVFVNGEFFEQRLDRFDLLLEEGTFHVDEQSAQLTVHLPRDVDPATAVFEVSVRDQLLRLQGTHDFTLRGLVFEHGNPSVPNTAVRIVDQNNVLIEDVIVRWNNWGGIWFRGNDIVVRNSISTRNGANGFAAFDVNRILLEGNESSFNSWRAYAGGLIGWSVGEKFLMTRDVTIRDHVSEYNLARGMWFDYDNENVLIERLRSCNNVNDGMFIEASQGPFEVIDSTFCHNERAGIRTSSSNNVTLQGNLFDRNRDGQLAISGDLDVEFESKDGTWLVLDNRSWTVVDNTMIGAEGIYLITTSLPRDNWRSLMASSWFEGNEYVHPEREAFAIYRGTLVDLEGWQRATLQDTTSTFRQE